MTTVSFFSVFNSWVYWVGGAIWSFFEIALDPDKSISLILAHMIGSYVFLLAIAFIGWAIYYPVMKKEKEQLFK